MGDNLLSILWNMFVTFYQSLLWLWNSLTTPITQIAIDSGITLPSELITLIGSTSLLNLILGGLGVFICVTLVKWVIDIFT